MTNPNPTTDCSIEFPLVIVESPYSGDVEANVAYARECIRDCLLRGEAPYASHLLYTQPGVLDDTVKDERLLGMKAGMAWGAQASRTVVYIDMGISSGMIHGIEMAKKAGRPVEYRSLGEEDPRKVLVKLETLL